MSANTFQAVVGDRRNPWSVRLYDTGKNNDLTGLTVTFTMYTAAGAEHIAATATGITIQPGITFTSATTDVCTANAHGLDNGWEIIVSNSGGALPTGLASTTRYFTRDVTPNTFKLAIEPNGAPVDITAAGSGTQTLKVLGHVQYAPSTTAVGTAGRYKGKFIVTESALTDTYPNDEDKIAIYIVAVN